MNNLIEVKQSIIIVLNQMSLDVSCIVNIMKYIVVKMYSDK